MKTNELRIGNWVIIDGQENQVDQIHDFFDQYPVKLINSSQIDQVSAIELTPEWILKLGGYKTIDPHKDHYRLENRLILKRKDGFYDYGSDVLLKHVHQTQNFIYALTGKELELTAQEQSTDSSPDNSGF